MKARQAVKPPQGEESYSSIYRPKLLTAVGEVRLGFSLPGSYKCLNMIKGLITLKSESEVITRRPRVVIMDNHARNGGSIPSPGS